MTHKSAAVCLCAVLLGGCSSVNVVKNPSPGDNGIRYYRPKPYLLVTPADATGRMVKLEVLQLPDYCEEYSIHPRGKKPPAVQLQDGWNLVGVGGSGPAPKGGAAPAAPPTDPLKMPEAVLVAGNVPIGLYESVFDTAGPVKFLKGWRYVGFSPWGGGPPNGTDAAATAAVQNGCPPCTSPGSVLQGPLYGIVFFNGAMTFRQIDEIANNMTCPEYIKPPIGGPPSPQPVPPNVETPSATPSGPGVIVPSRESAPVPPATNPPGSASMYRPRRSSAALDVRVSQTSTVTPMPTVKVVTPIKATTGPAPKTVDPKKLQALEAEVFKSLNYTPAAGANSSSSSTAKSSYSSGVSWAKPSDSAPSAVKATSSSSVPELTPATPLQ